MQTRRMIVQLGVLGALLGMTPAAMDAQRRRVDYLGEANVDGAVDHDMIRVGRGDGLFRAIQIKVSGGAIDFQQVIVHYGNGQRETIAFRERIAAGGQTRWIDLPGDRRVIQGVEFFYSKANWRSRKPKVRLYGAR